MKQILTWIFIISQLFLLAETIYVPDDYPAIQEAINESEDGDQVIVSPGTYTECINFLGKTITVASLFYTTQDTSYISQTVIDAFYNDSVVTFCNSETSTSVLSGFTLINGFSSLGGGIYCLEASPMLDHLTIYNCSANSYSGGGIYCESCNSIQMESLIIYNNTATMWGGGIFMNDCSNAALSNSEIRNNSSSYTGGGMQCLVSTMELENVIISDNLSGCHGGGIYAQNCDIITMQNCEVISNNVYIDHFYSSGGGVCFIEEGELVLDHVEILNNTAINGGGLYLGHYPVTEVTMDSVVIAGNSARISGGGIYSHNANLHITNSEIRDNVSDKGGGITFMGNQNAYLEDVMIANNRSFTLGGGIYIWDSYALLAGVTITENQAELGGGIFFRNSNPDFSITNLCSIYLNNIGLRGNGNELYSQEYVNIAIDTFTVLEPSSYHITDLSNFDISIQNGIIEQISADLYVSPDGDNMNSGLSAEEPLKTIYYACNCLLPQNDETSIIHLANGNYSYYSNGESFPVNLPDNVFLEGESQQNVILDATGSNSVMTFYNTNNCQVSRVTLQGGCDIRGGGVYLENSSPVFREVTLRNNTATESGGGMYCDGTSSPRLEKVTLINNTSTEKGGGIACISLCHPQLVNVTMANNQALMGGGIYCEEENYPVLVNSILWNNLPEQVYFATNQNLDNYITIAYSDIEGGQEEIVTNDGGFVNWLAGNLNTNPDFVNPETDYNLTNNSPCLNAGIAYFEYEGEVLVDMDESEYFGSAPDMGAWEYYPVENVEECIPNTGLALSNYPNPFNPETKIYYTTSDDTQITEIAIYNLKGRKVKTLIKDKVSEGEHTVFWNGEDESGKQCASGIFFCRISNGADVKVNKITLLK
ncbi:MAG: right-handed parallel beta-helix repeat-containing protein [Candidatus Stygibacter australis]|nr:right-handed parallel beta-helix repeat-containing protein [Candidatus Stygibacter australis]